MILCSLLSAAQGSTQSPYSILGLGELSYRGFMQHRAMGRTSISHTSENYFTPTNPASYANLRFTVYDVGLEAKFGEYTTADNAAPISSGNFSHFAMAFPFNTKKKMAVSFGTNQYSDVGYSIRNTISTDTPSYENIYTGDGGINRVYVGYGVSLLPNLNIGANANFNFGNILRRGSRVYTNTNNRFSFLDETYSAYRGFDFDLGMQYSVYDSARFMKPGNSLKHTFGLTAHTGTNINGNGYRFSQTFIGPRLPTSGEVPIDTILLERDRQDTLSLPFGFGLGYTLRNGDNWALSLEMEQYLWSNIAAPSGSASSFRNNTRLSAGISWVPRPVYEERGGYLKKIKYSIGGRYESLYYNLGSSEITQIGISFGLGLPVVKSVRIEEEKVAIVSTINLVAEFIKTGNTTNGLIQEDYINIGIGLNLNDKWFTKRKYR